MKNNILPGTCSNASYLLYLLRLTYADNSFSEYNYDKNSNLTRHITPGTKPIEYDYDELNRMIAKRFPQNTSLNAAYAYDVGSRLTSANTAASQIGFTYDPLNRVETTTQTINTSPLTIFMTKPATAPNLPTRPAKSSTTFTTTTTG